ncbi:unnamed protein product [Trypanosoma congolense IL3000]|uniref:WGS project CAEQ00000000 data, annotated contig 1620 n=1 Tax=Trypanosoma congolense (strain IL3000) TaxID=1068625 RepID=F9W7J2_TRYCI|nr:unnamed protein product [Trypanosoma congolense IL3000]
MAARAESVANGGQVLLTGATYYSLSAVERARLDLMPMGPVLLRGVPEPVEMYQLNAVPGRIFAALRLDREVDLINDESDATGSSPSDSSSSTATLCETSQMVARCLESVLGTFAPARRRSLLVAICERWRVSLPRKPEAGWDEDYCQNVIRRIALRVGHAMDLYAADRDHSTGRASSASVILMPCRRADTPRY